MTLSRNFLLFTLSLFAVQAFASGGDYGGGVNRSAQQSQVDHAYESGKAFFTGRHSNYRKIKYCFVADDGSATKVKSKNIKQFKKQPANDLVSALHRCDEPTQNISQVLKKNELIATVYYLNKRYKLKLK